MKIKCLCLVTFLCVMVSCCDNKKHPKMNEEGVKQCVVVKQQTSDLPTREEIEEHKVKVQVKNLIRSFDEFYDGLTDNQKYITRKPKAFYERLNRVIEKIIQKQEITLDDALGIIPANKYEFYLYWCEFDEVEQQRFDLYNPIVEEMAKKHISVLEKYVYGFTWADGCAGEEMSYVLGEMRKVDSLLVDSVIDKVLINEGKEFCDGLKLELANEWY